MSIDRDDGSCPTKLPPTTADAEELVETFLEMRQLALFDGITACRRALDLQRNGREDLFYGIWNVFATPTRVVSVDELPCEFECTKKDRLIRAVVEMRRVDGALYTNRLEFETTGRKRNIWSFLTELTDDDTLKTKEGDLVPPPGPGSVADGFFLLPEGACFANFGHKLLEPEKAAPDAEGPAQNAVVIVDCAGPHTWRVARTADLKDLVTCNKKTESCKIAERRAGERLSDTCDTLPSMWWGGYSYGPAGKSPSGQASCVVADSL